MCTAKPWTVLSLAVSAAAIHSIDVAPRAPNLTLGAFKDELEREVRDSRPRGYLPDPTDDKVLKEEQFPGEMGAGEALQLPGCEMTANETCPPHKMSKKEPTTVTPNDTQARCIGQSPYSFQVVPGDKDRLLIFFNGGGACWDEVSLSPPLCIPTLSRFGKSFGFYENCDGETDERPEDPYQMFVNPFQGYTVVALGMCSGDLFIGNRSTIAGRPIEQKGYYNTMATINWIEQHLGTSFKSVVITGHSAGALASLLWPRWLLDRWEHQEAHIFMGSFVSVFPEGFAGPVLKGFGICEMTHLFVDFPDFAQKCNSEKLSSRDMLDFVLGSTNLTSFSFITSKWDQVQRFFYATATRSVMAKRADDYCKGVASCDLSGAPPEVTAKVPDVTPNGFYELVQKRMSLYQGNSKVHWYLEEGEQHHIMKDPFHCTSSLGKIARYKPIRHWVSEVLKEHNKTARECEEGMWLDKPKVYDTTCVPLLGSEVIMSASIGASASLVVLLACSLLAL